MTQQGYRTLEQWQVAVGQELMFERRDAAIAQVEMHADAGWKDAAAGLVVELADRGVPFTSDDVVELLEDRGVSTHNLAALGPVFQRAARAGTIRKTGLLIPSRIPRRHRDLTEWIGQKWTGRP